MKHLPKSTLTEILNDPYGFTYKEMAVYTIPHIRLLLYPLQLLPTFLCK